jgi:hypothetical protein
MEFLLAPGDCIYIPRGFLHDAHTSDKSSFHVTLSIETVTWRDLIAEVLVADPQFRKTLPRHFGVGPVGNDKRQALATLVSNLAHSPHVDDALSLVTGRLFSNLETLPNGGLRGVENSGSLRADTWVGLADGVFGRVEVKKNSAFLHLPGASFGADRFMAPTFRFLLKQSAFRARDLPLKTTLNEKLKFVRALLIDGYLVRRPKPKN